MIVKRPSIYIYVSKPDETVLDEICAGIEEEGVFYEISEHAEDDVPAVGSSSSQEGAGTAHLLAWQAAQDSMLGSGIGVTGRTCAFSMRGLKAARCVESYTDPNKEQCRRLGANSARAIKKQAFK